MELAIAILIACLIFVAVFAVVSWADDKQEKKQKAAIERARKLAKRRGGW